MRKKSSEIINFISTPARDIQWTPIDMDIHVIWAKWSGSNTDVY